MSWLNEQRERERDGLVLIRDCTFTLRFDYGLQGYVIFTADAGDSHRRCSSFVLVNGWISPSPVPGTNVNPDLDQVDLKTLSKASQSHMATGVGWGWGLTPLPLVEPKNWPFWVDFDLNFFSDFWSPLAKLWNSNSMGSNPLSQSERFIKSSA